MPQWDVKPYMHPIHNRTEFFMHLTHIDIGLCILQSEQPAQSCEVKQGGTADILHALVQMLCCSKSHHHLTMCSLWNPCVVVILSLHRFKIRGGVKQEQQTSPKGCTYVLL